jgi:hypothetical protein
MKLQLEITASETSDNLKIDDNTPLVSLTLPSKTKFAIKISEAEEMESKSLPLPTALESFRTEPFRSPINVTPDLLHSRPLVLGIRYVPAGKYTEPPPRGKASIAAAIALESSVAPSPAAP